MSQRYRSIYDEAHEFYRKGRHYDAAVTFNQARLIALEKLMFEEAFSAGVWEVESWQIAGFYTRALALLLELLQNEPNTCELHHRWIARKKAIEISLAVTPDLRKLQQRLETLGNFHAEYKLLPESDIYHLTGQLLEFQGKWKEALEYYELAWGKYNGGYVKWLKAFFAARCNLRLGQVKSAKRWCELLGQTEIDWPESRRFWYELRGCLALYQGDVPTAEELAKETDVRSELIQRSAQTTLDLLVRTWLLRPDFGDPYQARHPVHFRLCQKPRFPLDVHDKYNRWLLIADFRLASVRYILGVSPVDDLWYQDPQQLPSTLPTQFTQSVFVKRQQLAWRAINRAMQQAQYLDNAFECHWRQDEVKQRQERLTEIVRFVTQQTR